MSLHLQIIIGSVREGRLAKPVGDWAHDVASRHDGFSVELVDLKAWNLPIFALPKGPSQGNYEDPLQLKWAKKIAAGDAYLFINPEYNHGYTSALKNALDYLYAEWHRKPATAVGYGSVKGARSLEQLRQVMVELHLAPLREAVHVDGVWRKVEDGEFRPGEADDKQLGKVLDELAWWGHALKTARRG